MSEIMKIAPELRLLKMLGEDLIKDEKTALIELVKNSYDADATKVKVFFKNFDSNYEYNKKSEIYIIDNGDGMTKEGITNNWLSPGTANKKRRKVLGEKTRLGRVYQGEKGIGRYSMLKLARSVELFTKTEEEEEWSYAKLDLSMYDEDYLNNQDGSNLLSDLKITYDEKKCDEDNIQKNLNEKGTIIKLSNLTGKWGSKKVNEIYDDLARLEPISKIIHGWKSNKDIYHYFQNFSVSFYLNDVETNHQKNFYDDLKKFLNLCDEKCLLSITNGFFNDETGTFEFYANGAYHTINIESPSFSYRAYKRYFKEEREDFKIQDLVCGPFNFEFYAFHFDNKNNYLKNFVLTPEEKELVEKHRIYLYRDNARVYPYGEPKNDWIEIDALRGLIRANQFLSNGQTVGFISITHDKNPLLRDKTNREGLIEDGNVTFEFIALIQSFLNYMRVDVYNNVINKFKKEDEEKKKQEAKERKKKEEADRKIKEEAIRKEREAAEKLANEKRAKEREEERKRIKLLEERERELQNRENKLKLMQKEVEEAKKKLDVPVVNMDIEKTDFFKQSNLLKPYLGDPIILNYNDLIKQVTSLSYDTHYLVYVIAFRVLVDDAAKCYIATRKLSIARGLGENVATMINDLRDIVKNHVNVLTNEQKEDLKNLMGGYDLYRNELDVIKNKFHDGAEQKILATELNTFAHNPKKIPKDQALAIANNVILPLMVLSQRVTSYVALNEK